MKSVIPLRRTALAIGTVFAVGSLVLVEPTFAEPTFHQLVTAPDPSQPLPTASPDGTATPEASPAPTESATPDASASTSASASPSASVPPLKPAVSVNFSGVASVSAKTVALVALVTKQVQMAKTPVGAKAVAKTLVIANYHWNSRQISCLNTLWDGESHWNYQSRNKRTGAHGIAQAMPASKMESVGMDWRTNPITQIKWGLSYIKSRYGTPCNALAHKRWSGYY